MRHPTRLRAEPLEGRDTPATFGIPWPDGQHLTLSLAPDGTPIGGSPSVLTSLLQNLGPSANLDVLRAFQTWVAQANLNIGLVSDNGAAFGTGGAVQGDPRFGDVRVGGRSLAPDVLALTAPYAFADNYSGDVVVNTAAGFGPAGYDLYTALLQESGHALGIGNSPDVDSVMYASYQGARAGLSDGDVASVQSLYGARTPDQFEGTTGNDTLATATDYSQPLEADLTTAQDVDVYKVTTDPLATGLTVSLHAAGLSLVTANVELLDAAGNVVASAAATDPTQNDVTLSADAGGPGTYYVRVSAARGDVFGVGAYDLSVTQRSPVATVTGLVGPMVDDTGVNDTPATATPLAPADLVGPQDEYHADGSFGSPSDADVYQVVMPAPGSGQPENLVATVWGHDGAVLNPWVEVDDAAGRTLPADVITADGNTTTVQARALQPGGVYFVKLTSDTGSVGEYSLSCDARPDTLTTPRGATGTLDAAHPSAARTVALSQTDQVHFVLAAVGSSGQAVLTVTAADGAPVAQLTVPVGRGQSADVLLPAGSYRVTVSALGGSPVSFALGLNAVTDPVVALGSDPTGTPDSGTGSGSGSGGSSGPGDGTGPEWLPPDPDADPAQWY
jgi:hypothetical protein